MISVITMFVGDTVINPTTSGGIIGTILLILVLVIKELTDACEDVKSQRLSQHMPILVLPLLFVFVFIITFKILEI